MFKKGCFYHYSDVITMSFIVDEVNFDGSVSVRYIYSLVSRREFNSLSDTQVGRVPKFYFKKCKLVLSDPTNLIGIAVFWKKHGL